MKALVRLLGIARRGTGQSRMVADFLLAWWNADECGGFALTGLGGGDADIARDMVTVFSMLARVQSYPDTLGYGDLLSEVVKLWRPSQVETHGSGKPAQA